MPARGPSAQASVRRYRTAPTIPKPTQTTPIASVWEYRQPRSIPITTEANTKASAREYQDCHTIPKPTQTADATTAIAASRTTGKPERDAGIRKRRLNLLSGRARRIRRTVIGDLTWLNSLNPASLAITQPIGTFTQLNPTSHNSAPPTQPIHTQPIHTQPIHTQNHHLRSSRLEHIP